MKKILISSAILITQIAIFVPINRVEANDTSKEENNSVRTISDDSHEFSEQSTIFENSKIESEKVSNSLELGKSSEDEISEDSNFIESNNNNRAIVSGMWGTVPYSYDDKSKKLTIGGPKGTNGTLGPNGTQPWRNKESGIRASKIGQVVIESKVYAPSDSSYLFSSPNSNETFSTLNNFVNVNNLDVSQVTNASYMFYVFGGNPYTNKYMDVSNWDVSNLTNAEGMFCFFRGKGLNGISNWDVSKLANAQEMFAYTQNLDKLDLSNWNILNLLNTSSMFNGSAATLIDLSNWNTEKLTDTNNMFYYCRNLNTIQLSNWNTSNLTNTERMFGECFKLTNLDVSKWDVSQLSNAKEMFIENTSLTNLDVSEWDVSRLSNAQSMFSDMKSLTNLDVSKWDVSRLSNAESMFARTDNLNNLDISNWNTSNVTRMAFMFQGNPSRVLDVTNWNVSKVKNFSFMFDHCSELTTLDLSNWNTSYSNVDTNTYVNTLNKTTSLWKLTLGEKSKFIAWRTSFPSLTNERWINVGVGTDKNPEGDIIGSGYDLMVLAESGVTGVYVKQNSIKLDGNGGTPSHQEVWGTVAYPIDLNQNTKIIEPTKNENLFKGWSTSLDGDTKIMSSVPVSRTSGQMIYAMYDQKHSYIKGDINEDGVVDLDDLVALRAYLNTSELPEGVSKEYVRKVGDVNEDGVVDLDDLVALRAYLNTGLWS